MEYGTLYDVRGSTSNQYIVCQCDAAHIAHLKEWALEIAYINGTQWNKSYFQLVCADVTTLKAWHIGTH